MSVHVNSNGEFFTPSTETLEFCHEMLNFSVGDSECDNGIKCSGVITAILQLGNVGHPFGIVEFSHAFVNELAFLAANASISYIIQHV